MTPTEQFQEALATLASTIHTANVTESDAARLHSLARRAAARALGGVRGVSLDWEEFVRRAEERSPS